MTFKSDLMSINFKQSSFSLSNPLDAGNDVHQFSNYNLNQNIQKCSNLSFVQPSFYQSKSSNNEKYFVSDSCKKSWNKSSKNNCLNSKFSDSRIFDVEEDEKVPKHWKTKNHSNSKSKNASNLSLYISAYEDSIEDSEISAGIIDKNYKTLNSPFEFPRQQKNELTEPEIMQFQASQRLFNPNQSFPNQNLGSHRTMSYQPAKSGGSAGWNDPPPIPSIPSTTHKHPSMNRYSRPVDPSCQNSAPQYSQHGYGENQYNKVGQQSSFTGINQPQQRGYGSYQNTDNSGAASNWNVVPSNQYGYGNPQYNYAGAAGSNQLNIPANHPPSQHGYIDNQSNSNGAQWNTPINQYPPSPPQYGYGSSAAQNSGFDNSTTLWNNGDSKY